MSSRKFLEREHNRIGPAPGADPVDRHMRAEDDRRAEAERGAVGILRQAVEELDGLDVSAIYQAELVADFVAVAKAFLTAAGRR